MDNRKTDLGKQHKPAEGSRDNLKAELSEEELSKVSGGRLGSACATGEHMKIDRATKPTTKELSEAELEKATGGSQSSGAGAGKVPFNPFSITRKIDKSSPVLF